MALPIPVSPMPVFDPHGEPTSVNQRWKKWINSFNIYPSVTACTDKKQKRQLLLHSAGSEVQDIFKTLTDTGDAFNKAAEKNSWITIHRYRSNHTTVTFSDMSSRQTQRQSFSSSPVYVISELCDFDASIEDFIRDQVLYKCKSKT